jgi:DNA repair protein RadC
MYLRYTTADEKYLNKFRTPESRTCSVLFSKQGGDEHLIAKWKHPGGKLREEGADNLTDAELLAILISSGIKGKPAEKIAEEVLDKFGSLEGLANQPLEQLLDVKGLSDVKIIRIAAAFELARRLAGRTGHSPR